MVEYTSFLFYVAHSGDIGGNEAQLGAKMRVPILDGWGAATAPMKRDGTTFHSIPSSPEGSTQQYI